MKDKPAILIVDDEPANVSLMEAVLAPYDYRLYTAVNGNEALKIIDSHQIDLILLDVMMPGMNGYEVTRYLKSDERTQGIPVILVTALSEKKDRVKGIEAGCDDFINKPIDTAEVTARVKSSLKIKAYNDHMRNYEAELENEVSKRTKEIYTAMSIIEEASLETINRLSVVAEYRDEDTGLHIMRMSRYAATIAQQMSLDDGLVKALLYASPMHDIGKIGIPDRILLKPGKLDPEEWELMKQHTTIGAKILQGSKHGYMKLAEEISLTHHEKWNGAGYPQGLAGEHIPISGRIAAVADVFDALISKRPYKAALSPKESFDIIEQERGKHFDPGIVDAFLSVKSDILTIISEVAP